MFDGFLKSKYHTKCKSLLRMIKTRLEVSKKKGSSVVKFLKNDIADLLRNGLDSNAYGRVQGLLAEQKMVTCYTLMEQFCDSVYNNVNAMAKQRECPEESREAVQSLMYAAARVSEIPELRDLRKVFTERYGNDLEPYTNKQLVEAFKPVSATKEMKLQILNEIAAEYNLNWNSKSLENELNTTDVKHGSFRNKDDKRKGHFEDYNLPRSSSEMNLSRRGDSSDLASSSSVRNSSEDEIESKNPYSYKSIPPPYVKTPPSKSETKTPESPKDTDFSESSKPKPRSVRRSRGGENPGSSVRPPPGREWSLEDKEKAKSPTILGSGRNEGFGIRKSKSDEVLERFIDEGDKGMKKHSRTVSEQAQPQFKHVHPNLPDDFDARLAALRGRCNGYM